MTQKEFHNKYGNIDPDLISYYGSMYNEELKPNYNLKSKDDDKLWFIYRRDLSYFKGMQMGAPNKNGNYNYYAHYGKINLYALSYRNNNLRIIHPEMKKTALLLNRLNFLNQEKKNTDICNTTDENNNLRIIHPEMNKTVLLLNRLNLLNQEKKNTDVCITTDENKNDQIKEKVIECVKSEDEDHCIEYRTSPNKSDNFQDELLKVYRDGYNEYKNKCFELFERNNSLFDKNNSLFDRNNELLNEINNMILLLAQHNIQYSSNKGDKNKDVINDASI
jgi:hypothetical protein